jgi:predicted CXXCH cytochrome family protein
MVVVFSVAAYAVKKPTTSQKTCITSECHAEYASKPFVHGPVELGDCASCHAEVNASAHTYKIKYEGKDLCSSSSCHLEMGTKKNVHEPVKNGDCLGCHDPHSSDNKQLLKAKTVAEACAECHEVTEGKSHLHGPTAVGECSICHDPHSSDHKSLMTVEPKTLCFSCHETTRDELEKFEFVHEPATGDCTGCHDPHGADNWQMLKASAPEMCYTCHDDIKELAETAKHKHSPITKEGGCLKCHTPHASTIKYILKDDPATLCMTCHSKPQGISKDEVLPAFTDQLEGKKFMHGPVAEKDCNGCHKTHGSDHFRLLIEEYPPQFYSPFAEENYDLCFTCHKKTLVLSEKTKNLTDFRNGSTNLHYLHVNKDRRGRTCRSCHQTHASNKPKHIRESVPYGMWDLPVQFEKTDDGGSCQPGCHAPKAYNRKKPVDYKAAPVAKKKEDSSEKKDDNANETKE